MAYVNSGLKKITSIHDRLAIEMDRCFAETDIFEWRTKGKTTLIQKDLQKRAALNNYRPITVLPIMWKGINLLNVRTI